MQQAHQPGEQGQAAPRLTFSQGLLKKVVLGLELRYQVPALQILFHFL